ncbi:hypothetical protein BH10BAC3_BH10BAC3_43200 [soil metagenome]
MKKLMTMAVAVLLVSGAAFAGGKKCADGKQCSKKEGKSCQKEKKADKPSSTSTAPKG